MPFQLFAVTGAIPTEISNLVNKLEKVGTPEYELAMLTFEDAMKAAGESTDESWLLWVHTTLQQLSAHTFNKNQITMRWGERTA